MTPKADPATPAFWNARFRENRIPWDSGSVPPALERYLAREQNTGRVLIPGCGSAYEVRSFAEKGYEVLAIDFSEAALEKARAVLGAWHTALLYGDFFTHDFGAKPFDIIYERAFLASLPPAKWTAYAARLAELLAPGGRLIGFFVHSEERGGPPFSLKAGELPRLLGERFEKIEETAVSASVPVFEGKEHWEVWIRRN